MQNYFKLLALALLVLCCKNGFKPRNFTKVDIEILKEDSLLSVRALEFNEEYVFYGSADHIGKLALRGENKIDLTNLEFKTGKKHYKNVMTYEEKPLHFRAISEVEGQFFAISVANPARLYKITRKGTESKLVYEEEHDKVFYDSMDFWNDQEGIAMGDPTDNCMSIIITRDGGNTWTKIPCERLPKAYEGEAAFAASDTNIAVVGDKTWIATGGKSSRVLYSADKGKTWEVFETPIIQGKETTGMYSIDFYDELQGFAIGGDYTKPNDTIANKVKTVDGGKTWRVVANVQSPGYRSCVQYIPNREGKELVTVGFKGIDYSNDGGETWTNLSDEGFYTIRFIDEKEAYAAGRGRICKLTFKE